MVVCSVPAELFRPGCEMERPQLPRSVRRAVACERSVKLTMMRTLFLQAPSFDGYDGGAGARYQMRREVKSFWYPTWLAQPAALVEGSKLIDAPPHALN